MIFSKRMELGNQLNEWCEEHNCVKEGLGYVTALDALGYIIEKPDLSCSDPLTGSVSLSDVRGNADYCIRMIWDALNRLSKTVKCTDEDLVLFKAVAEHPQIKQNVTGDQTRQ